MVKFRGMGRNGYIALIFMLACFLTTCNGFLCSHSRKLIDNPPGNASPSQISPVRSPDSSSNTSSVNTDDKSTTEKHEESGRTNQNDDSSNKSNNTSTATTNSANNNNTTNSANSKNTTKKSDNSDTNTTLPADSKGSKNNDAVNKDSEVPSPPSGANNDGSVDGGREKDDNETKQKMNNDTCVGSLATCRDKGMLACIEISGDGSKEMFLVVQNEGESSLKVNVRLPDSLQNILPAFDVPKHENTRKEISSTLGQNTKLIVDSVDAKCTLALSHPVSVDNLMQQLSFYSKQVTPIYGVYALFLLTLLFGGTWACCKLRKRRHENGIPYQELEMALPESTSNVNVDSAEGWDHDWDDDDWDEENAVRSPSNHGVRNLSADGLTSRAAGKDGWDDDWED